MPTLIVEVHVPLLAAPDGTYPWIDTAEDFLAGLEQDTDGAEDYDDGEQHGDVYLFFLTGTHLAPVLAAASHLATLDGIPPGAFAMITDDDAEEFGLGRRIELPVT
ncbi:hypothetical protein [Actinoplanes couchii]|nr:hypothetical protein [Actinoplanes couchii]MDR6319321.1 hypothetical protein [Actinoplanes couchii]